MKTESVAKKIYTVLIILITVGILAIALAFTGVIGMNRRGDLQELSDGWTMPGDPALYRINDVRVVDYGGKVDMSIVLPDDLKDDDSVCFESLNVNLEVLIDDNVRYSFNTVENMTGFGYGYAFHIVGLSRSDAGRTLTLRYEGVVKGVAGAQILNVYRCSSADYIRTNMRSRTSPRILSVLIIVFGFILIMIYFRIKDKSKLPFDVGAFGLSAVFLGAWLLVDTNIFQLMTGNVFFFRIINRTVVFLSAYPLIVFVNSLTRLRRKIYYHVAFWFSVITMEILLLLRFFAGIDMVRSFSIGIVFYALGLVVMIAVIFIDNALYCRANGIEINLKAFYIGALVFLSCVLVDYILFRLNLSINDSFGTISRFGVLAMIMILMLRFFSWWTRDQVSIGRDRFVNNVLQYAMSSGEPETGIQYMLEFLGKSLGARRVFVFEDQNNGRFHGTYEWYEEGNAPASIDLLYLPAEGFADVVHKHMKSNENRLTVDDVEAWKTMNPALYNVLKSNNLSRIVAGPLEADTRLFGFLVLADLPQEKMDDAASVISLVSYFLSQLILRRDEQKRLRLYSYNDPLTGALNRHAYREYVKEELDMSQPFGYLAVEIAGLERANYSIGYEAGDRMIKEVAECIGDVFGKDNTYRVGGTEFVAFGFETDESYFLNDLDRVRKLIKEKDLKVYLGGVYCLYGTMNIEMVIKRANELLQVEKESINTNEERRDSK